MAQEPFVIERTYDSPVEKVWKAISDVEQMKEWYFDVPEFKAEVGNEFSFTGGPDEDHVYTHLCKVMEVVPNKILKYSWRYKGYEGNSFVTFELFEEGDKTRVKLTHECLETFPADNKDFDKKNFEMGWTEIIGKNLPEYLQK